MKVLVSRFGGIDCRIASAIVSPVQTAFGLPCSLVEQALPMPLSGHNSGRGQWLAKSLTSLLAATAGSQNLQLGITDVDLYTPGLNFVFGEALVREGCAVFSVARLDDRFYGARHMDPDTFQRRCATEAVHELGHLLGLPHCRRRDCVMWFSNTLEETDAKGWRLCDGCAAAVRRWPGWREAAE